MKLIRKLLQFVFISIFLAMCFTAINYFMYWFTTLENLHNHPGKLKAYHHILILGAGKKNPVFYSRMNAALELNRYLRLDRITCSGLTGVRNYTEPYDMRDFLLGHGIADSILFIDTAGSHTINSIINYSNRYPGDSVIIVSQAQHLGRALFIARCKGLHVAGYVAQGRTIGYSRRWFTYEYLARIKSSLYLIFY